MVTMICLFSQVDYDPQPIAIEISESNAQQLPTLIDISNSTDNITDFTPTMSGTSLNPDVIKYVPVSIITLLSIKFSLLFYLQTYLYSSALVLAAISVFLRMGFLLKLCLMVISVVVHILIYSYLDFFQEYHDQDIHDDE